MSFPLIGPNLFEPGPARPCKADRATRRGRQATRLAYPLTSPIDADERSDRVKDKVEDNREDVLNGVKKLCHDAKGGALLASIRRVRT